MSKLLILSPFLFSFFLPCIRQSWEFSWSEHDFWFGWWSDICCWTSTIGRPAENIECYTTIRYQLKIMSFWVCSSILPASQICTYIILVISDAMADPDAGKCRTELMRFCVWLAFCIIVLVGMTGLGLGDILKPDLILPLIETLPIEQLATYLPEVCISYLGFQFNWPFHSFSGNCSIPGFMDCWWYSWTTAKSSFATASRS